MGDALIRAVHAALAAVRNRRSLRKTDLIRAPQHSPPTNEVCQYTPHGLLRTYGSALTRQEHRSPKQIHGVLIVLNPTNGNFVVTCLGIGHLGASVSLCVVSE